MTIKDGKNNNTDEPDINLSTYPDPEAQSATATPFSQALDSPPPAATSPSYSSATPVATATYVGTAADYEQADNNKPSTTTDNTYSSQVPTATATATIGTTSQVPPGASPGGQWVMAKYAGAQTWSIIGVTGCLLCFFCAIILGPCALFGLACPCDESRAYMQPNGDLIDPSGKKIGHRDKNKWVKI